MPVVRVLLVLIISIACTSAVMADGKVFRRGVAELPPIPDQQAIIAWDAATSTETLAIETRFVAPPAAKPSASSSGDPPAPYAWVVPLPGPNAPTITAATPGLFPTVRAVFQPSVDDHQSPDTLSLTIPLGALFVLYAWLRGRKNSVLVSALVIFAMALLIAFALLPTLGRARGSAPGRDVVVLDRSIVGSYETTVVGAAEGSNAPDAAKAIAEWLDSGGFPLPAECRPVLADYASRKWVFAAVKLREDANVSGGMLTPHPLVFRFSTSRAVYPMALTGVGNKPLTLDLYVFGAEQAAAPGLNVVRCDGCDAKPARYPSVEPPQSIISVAHPGLHAIVGALPVGTKLSGVLPPAAQSRDVELTWRNAASIGAQAFSRRGAANRAIEVGAGVALLGMIGLYIIGAVRSAGPRWVLRRMMWTLPLGAVVGGVLYLCTPVVGVVPEGYRAVRLTRYALTRDLPQTLLMEFDNAADAPTLEEVRRAALAYAKEREMELRFEDAPGGVAFELTESPKAVWYATYDATGTPFWMQIWGDSDPAEKAHKPSLWD